MPKYAELIYNGFWFSPEREMLQASIDISQKNVSGTVRAKLYKGNVIITGRDGVRLQRDALVHERVQREREQATRRECRATDVGRAEEGERVHEELVRESRQQREHGESSGV